MDEKASKWQILSIAFAAGAFIISMFNYLSQEESRLITKEIDKLKLEAMREEKNKRQAIKATDTDSPPSTAPESSSEPQSAKS